MIFWSRFPHADYYVDDLWDWGYQLFDVTPVYCDYSSGGYWGISKFLQNQGITDKCDTEKKEGHWRSQAIFHYDPEPDDLVEPASQVYKDKYGKTRRVGPISN